MFNHTGKILTVGAIMPGKIINSNNLTIFCSQLPRGINSLKLCGLNMSCMKIDNTVNFYVVAETEKNGSVYQPRIYEYDGNMNYQSRAWADYYFTSANSNKAFEGISWVYRGGEDYMICIVEGTGKMPVLKKTSGDWVLVDSITLPPSVTFTDYAEVCVYGNKIAILSQQDSQFWIGTLSGTSWTITGGTAYEFPHGSSTGVVGAGDYVLYGNVEGISFISNTQVVVVSDKADNSQPSYQTYKDQSIHIFNLP